MLLTFVFDVVDLFLFTPTQKKTNQGNKNKMIMVIMKGRFAQFAISSPLHYYRLAKMYINTLNVWTTYDKMSV